MTINKHRWSNHIDQSPHHVLLCILFSSSHFLFQQNWVQSLSPIATVLAPLVILSKVFFACLTLFGAVFHGQYQKKKRKMNQNSKLKKKKEVYSLVKVKTIPTQINMQPNQAYVEKIKLSLLCSLRCCLALSVFEFATPGLYFHKSWKQRLFSNKFCSDPEQSLRQRNIKAYSEWKEKCRAKNTVNSHSFWFFLSRENKTQMNFPINYPATQY